MIFGLLQSTKLKTRVLKPPNMNEEVDIENIRDHLGLIEDLITQVTVMSSYINHEASPALKAVPINSLEPKDFDILPIALLSNQFAFLDEKEETNQEEIRIPLSRNDFIKKANKLLENDIDWESYSPVSLDSKTKIRSHV